jgi:hypothetical protein
MLVWRNYPRCASSGIASVCWWSCDECSLRFVSMQMFVYTLAISATTQTGSFCCIKPAPRNVISKHSLTHSLPLLVTSYTESHTQDYDKDGSPNLSDQNRPPRPTSPLSPPSNKILHSNHQTPNLRSNHKKARKVQRWSSCATPPNANHSGCGRCSRK